MSSVKSDLLGLSDAFEALTPNDWLALHQHSGAPDRSVIRRPTSSPLSTTSTAGSSASSLPGSLKLWPLVAPRPYAENEPSAPKMSSLVIPEQLMQTYPQIPKIQAPEGVKVEVRGLSQQPKPKKPSFTPGQQPGGGHQTAADISPVEQCTVPAVKRGNNVVVCIQSEKIAVSAILVPAIHRSAQFAFAGQNQKRDFVKHQASTIGGHRIRMMAKSTAPSTLVLAPTKDVAERVFEETVTLTRRTNLNAILIRGGIDSRPQLQALQRGCDILVATVGRLMDFLERGYISMSHVVTFILWEAGHMSNIGLQMKLRRIANFEGMIGSDHQTLVYTKAFPRRLECFCDSLMEHYTYVATDTTASCLGITQNLEFVKDDAHKRRVLLSTFKKLSSSSRTLVFVATKRTADSVTKWLASQGVHAEGLHGGRSQEEREASLQAFQDSSLHMLIATDVANHVFEQLPSVDLVVNFDMPTNIDAYIRRTGRTLASGVALALISESCLAILPALANVLKQCKQSAPTWFCDMVLQANHDSEGISTAVPDVKRLLVPL